LLEPPPPPQAERLPNASISTTMPSIARHPRRRAGIPKNIIRARIALEPPSARPLPGNAGRLSEAVVAALVVTVAVPLPLCANAAEETEHVGVSPAELVGAPEFSVHEL